MSDIIETIETTATKPKKATKPKAEPKATVAKDTQNGIARPSAGTQTGKVWEICDRLSNSIGQPTARKPVMEEGRAAGINDATIATQYSRWRRYNGLVNERVVAPATVAETAELPEVAVEV